MSFTGRRYPMIDAVIKEANEEGFSVDYYLDNTDLNHMVRVFFDGSSVGRKISQETFEALGEKVVVNAIKEMIAELMGLEVKGKRNMTEVQLKAELEKYKAAVKQLSFDLEMAQGRGGADTAIRVNEIRRMALEQAADYVMDYGIPKTGADLEKLCGEIKGLKETRNMAMQRAADAMSQKFGGGKEHDIPF